MHYEGNIIRPPSETDSIILQVTVGCSHNKCTFCGAYKGSLFKIKNDQIIDADLDFAARYCRQQKRVFLADGDALILPQASMVVLLKKIRDKLPLVNRISLYANPKSIRMKSLEQLVKLKELGLDRVYMGLESGHDGILASINKGANSTTMIEAGKKVKKAGLFLSVTVLLGIGGLKQSLPHAEATGRVLTVMSPNQIAALTLMLIENTSLYQDAIAGFFQLPSQKQLLLELKTMLQHIQLKRVQFQANHSSNYLPINARLARDKDEVMNMLDRAINGEIELIPEYQRAL